MRLKDLDNETIQTMLESVAVRYRVKCDELNATLIRQTLQAEYSNLLVEKFNNAFIKHTAGRFMISDKQEGNKPYGDLSAQFVCQVIKFYNEYLAKENAKPKLIEVEKQIEHKDISVEDHRIFVEKFIKEKGKLPEYADWNNLYLHLEKLGEFKITVEEKEMYVENVRCDIEEKIVVFKSLHKDTSPLKDILKDSKLFKIECRKRYIIKYYEGKIK